MQERLDREQSGEQRYKNHTNNGYTSASHELLHALRFCARVVVAVTFQQVDYAPDAKTGSEGNDEGLQHIDCAIEEIHILCAGIVSLWFL